VTTEQRDKLKRLGGSVWIRRMIDKAREPRPGTGGEQGSTQIAAMEIEDAEK
jgi:hypothetical protein